MNIDFVLPITNKTCLQTASENGLTKFVEYLLSKGANPNKLNETKDFAPIYLAVKNGHVGTLAALLEKSTLNPNLEAEHQTALHIAVKRNDLDCANMLLEKSASLNIPDVEGFTALHLAANNGQFDMVKLILQKCKLCLIDTSKDDKGRTTREVIQKNLPGISLPPKKREVNEDDLKYYLIANDEANFQKSVKLVKTEVLHSVAEELLEMTELRYEVFVKLRVKSYKNSREDSLV